MLRNMAGPTRRVSKLEDGMLVQPMFDADDTDPANAARMSFDMADRERTRESDLKLCDYLMKSRHTSPFEMIEVWLEMKMPIFVARQFIRHRTISLNEVSARYVKLPAEWYVPALGAVVLQTKDKKQGGRLVDVHNPEEVERAQRYIERLKIDCSRSYGDYLASSDDGIAMEQARCHLHVNHYTHWIWKQDLHNLMHFMALRDHGHAQSEAQAYARAVDGLVREHLPHCMALYDRYRKQQDDFMLRVLAALNDARRGAGDKEFESVDDMRAMLERVVLP